MRSGPTLQVLDLATSATQTIDLPDAVRLVASGDLVVWLEHTSLQPTPEIHLAPIASLLALGRPPDAAP